MLALRYLSILGCLATSTIAQASFGAPENSAAILDALKAINDATEASAQAASAYQPNDPAATKELTYQNYVLRSDWQYIMYLAQSSQGFYSDSGAQAIIDYITGTLYPSTRDADKIYTDKRDVFIQGGFIDFINPGLIQLRLSVADSASAVIAKTPANRLTAVTLAFLLIQQNYADTQEYQQFGAFPTPTAGIPCVASGTTPIAAPSNGYGIASGPWKGRYGTGH